MARLRLAKYLSFFNVSVRSNVDGQVDPASDDGRALTFGIVSWENETTNREKINFYSFRNEI